jgi:hypothetical protein
MDLACRLLSAERRRLVRTDLAVSCVEVIVDTDPGGFHDALNDIAVESASASAVTTCNGGGRPRDRAMAGTSRRSGPADAGSSLDPEAAG